MMHCLSFKAGFTSISSYPLPCYAPSYSCALPHAVATMVTGCAAPHLRLRWHWHCTTVATSCIHRTQGIVFHQCMFSPLKSTAAWSQGMSTLLAFSVVHGLSQMARLSKRICCSKLDDTGIVSRNEGGKTVKCEIGGNVYCRRNEEPATTSLHVIDQPLQTCYCKYS